MLCRWSSVRGFGASTHCGTTVYSLVLLGFVRLGHHHAGRSFIAWDVRVGRHLLAEGRDQLILYALDGAVLSRPPTPARAR